MRKASVILMTVAALGVSIGCGLLQAQKQDTLDIYSIDMEGGQATLFVSPSGETMLVDAGNPGGSWGPGLTLLGNCCDGRVIAAAKAAGVKQIDYFVASHYDADHIGGVADVAAQVPIRNFIDHGDNFSGTRPGALDVYHTYAAARDKGHHMAVKPGDRIPIAGLDVQIVTAGGEVIKKPLPGGGSPNPLCADFTPQEMGKAEDPLSVGILIRYGTFSMLDLGDLTWNVEHDLVCPNNPIGPVDLYYMTRHGLNGAGYPGLVHALRPRVALSDNGPMKGLSREAFMTVKSSPGLEDIWQSHFRPAQPAGPDRYFETSPQGGSKLNTSEQMIANLDCAADHTTAYNIKISVRKDGSFVVTNQRNGYSKEYKVRR